MKNFSKYFSIFFFISFFVIFSYVNSGEYFDFYKKGEFLDNTLNNTKEELLDFSLDKIRDLKDTKFEYTPNKNFIKELLSYIDNSKEKIYLEVYIFTYDKIRESLIKAKKRGVYVKVVLENNPYNAPNLNNKTFDELTSAGIDVVWSNPNNFALNHSKFMIIDDIGIMSTGNFSYSTFSSNRDMFLITKDNKIVSSFLKIFEYDFSGLNSFVYDDSLILSPNYSRLKIETLIKSAKKSIKIHIPYINDDKIKEILIEKAKENIDIKIIISENSYKENLDLIKKFKDNDIKIVFLDKLNMHSKAILVDEKYLFIGSVNFSNYSLDKNREIGLLLTNNDIIKKYLELFNLDFRNNS